MKRPGEVSTAIIVPTPELLKQMLHERLPCWPLAAFASVLMQRLAALEQRKVDQLEGFPLAPTGRLPGARPVARFVIGRIRAADDIVRQIEILLRATEFIAAFGDPNDEATADADVIVAAAHQISDHYQRLLDLAEECRRNIVPAQYADLVIDCARLLNQLLQDYGGFVDDILERLETVQERVAGGGVAVMTEPIRFDTRFDDRTAFSILDRLQEIG